MGPASGSVDPDRVPAAAGTCTNGRDPGNGAWLRRYATATGVWTDTSPVAESGTCYGFSGPARVLRWPCGTRGG
ncbi:hypothetical protein GCM10020295_13860 [Streptomyces cinereospinus]